MFNPATTTQRPHLRGRYDDERNVSDGTAVPTTIEQHRTPSERQTTHDPSRSSAGKAVIVGV